MAKDLLLERALFVVAPRHCGKSTQLRSIFRDRRLGRNGRVPASSKKKLDEIYHLSNERRLYLRLTSPHEVGENPDDFLRKTEHKMISGRWCFIGPLHPRPFRNMPDVVRSIRQFVRFFDPERVRVVLLSPNPLNIDVTDFLPGHDLCAALLAIDDRVEVICIDARRREANGLVLADFFDFT